MAVISEDGSVQLNTTELGKDIVGYGGTVPLEITLQDGIKSIKALANSGDSRFLLLRLRPSLRNGMARR